MQGENSYCEENPSMNSINKSVLNPPFHGVRTLHFMELEPSISWS